MINAEMTHSVTTMICHRSPNSLWTCRLMLNDQRTAESPHVSKKETQWRWRTWNRKKSWKEKLLCLTKKWSMRLPWSFQCSQRRSNNHYCSIDQQKQKWRAQSWLTTIEENFQMCCWCLVPAYSVASSPSWPCMRALWTRISSTWTSCWMWARDHLIRQTDTVVVWWMIVHWKCEVTSGTILWLEKAKTHRYWMLRTTSMMS